MFFSSTFLNYIFSSFDSTIVSNHELYFWKWKWNNQTKNPPDSFCNPICYSKSLYWEIKTINIKRYWTMCINSFHLFFYDVILDLFWFNVLELLAHYVYLGVFKLACWPKSSLQYYLWNCLNGFTFFTSLCVIGSILFSVNVTDNCVGYTSLY